MSDPVEALIADLLERIGPRPRPCAEVIEAWRTSCPRLPVWEEANERGFKGSAIVALATHRIAQLGIGYAPEESHVFGDLNVEGLSRDHSQHRRRYRVDSSPWARHPYGGIEHSPHSRFC